MIRYYCKRCNETWETSDCPICKAKEKVEAKGENRRIRPLNYRTEPVSRIYWCSECNIPIYEPSCQICGHTGTYIATDIRPVFPEEKLLLGILRDEPNKYMERSVWNGTGNKYFVDGVKEDIKLEDLMQKPSKQVIKELNDFKEYIEYGLFNENIEKFIRANTKRFHSIVTEAMDYIRRVSKGYDLERETFVSFSGGKDATVTYDLVKRALSEPKIKAIFGDTTLEFDSTEEYIGRFKQENRMTPILTAKNKDKTFYELAKLLGPPSRVMRWCCITFKTGAITRKLDATFKEKNNILTFYGIRRNESTARNKYERESISPKIVKQKIVSPIIDWYDFDVWLYIMTIGIDFNAAYRKGYARVGCFLCPNNTSWNEYLTSIYMPKKYDEWKTFLLQFAKQIGKPDPDVYIEKGNWKARQGGNGLDLSNRTFVAFKPCATELDSFNYELKREITEELYELFKPFGKIDMERGNKRIGEVFVLDKEDKPVLRVQGRVGSNILKVTIFRLPLSGAKSMREARQKIDCQITKYQLCIGCRACESVCKYDALTVKINKRSQIQQTRNEEVALTTNQQNAAKSYEGNSSVSGNKYIINSEKCMRCGECINHFDGGCYVRKVVITRRGE